MRGDGPLSNATSKPPFGGKVQVFPKARDDSALWFPAVFGMASNVGVNDLQHRVVRKCNPRNNCGEVALSDRNESPGSVGG